MCMRNYQANLQAPTVPAVASALMDRQMRTRMFQGGVTSYTESEFTKKQQKKNSFKCGNGETSWEEQQGTGLNMNAWPPLSTPFGRLYGKQVKWWQSGKSS